MWQIDVLLLGLIFQALWFGLCYWEEKIFKKNGIDDSAKRVNQLHAHLQEHLALVNMLALSKPFAWLINKKPKKELINKAWLYLIFMNLTGMMNE